MWRLVAAVFVLAVSVTGCTASGAFFVDERVKITSPEDRSSVSLPVTVEWTAEPGLEVAAYGLFLDRDPIGPGEDLASVAEGDDQCVAARGCPDRAYLNERGVYITGGTHYSFATVGEGRDADRPGAEDRHDLTIVLLDDRDVRIGESAFYVSFDVEDAA